MNPNRKSHRVLVGCVLFSFLLVLPQTRAQSQPLPVPGYPAATNVPGARGLPDPAATYKVVFDITQGAAKTSDVNPGLATVAEYVNTLAQYGVPPSHRKIAVVLHRNATEIVEDDATFRARHNGSDNPNIALVQSLAKAGVRLHVCGQGVTRNNIDPKSIQPEIELDLWALTTLIDLERQGYVRVGD
jgi:intracellular sulfur oxidation DsrE/DsrF family protein